MDRTTHGELNNPFIFTDGRPVRSTDEWRVRRAEIERIVVGIEYGGLPPEPAPVRAEQLHSHLSRILLDSSYTQYRIVLESDPRFHFRLDLTIPPGEGAVPCVLTGDGCWPFITHDISRKLVKLKIALAVFSRTEVVPDIYSNDRDTGLYSAFPGETFGALAAWAWAYHRCVDVLEEMERIDSKRIGVVGHSRGGKTALLAGATDERIALVGPNGSGSGGAGCYRWQGPDSETLEDTHRMISYWFGPELWKYVGNEEAMPFDQHFLKMLVAPRPLVSTEGLGDLWSNPEGTYQSFAAAREVYGFLGVEENIGVWYRPGDHDHGTADWNAFIEFFEWRLNGKMPDLQFNTNPYPDMERAFSWSRPG